MLGVSPLPRLSVVVPTHDTRELTSRCLAALAAVPEPLEVLVVDDASSDGTAEALAVGFPQVAVLRCPTSVGFTRAANLGLARARGEIVLLLNSDTEVEPAGVGELLAAFDADPRLGAAEASSTTRMRARSGAAGASRVCSGWRRWRAVCRAPWRVCRLIGGGSRWAPAPTGESIG